MHSLETAATWNDDRVATLKQLVAAGYSAGRIAEQLGGVSRNAVIGKAHRLKLSLSGSTEHRSWSRGSRRIPRPRREPRLRLPRPVVARPVKGRPELEPVTPAITPLLVTMFDLQPTHCRWPYGDPRKPGFGFCGHARPTIVVNGDAVPDPTCSYCEVHFGEGTRRSA